MKVFTVCDDVSQEYNYEDQHFRKFDRSTIYVTSATNTKHYSIAVLWDVFKLTMHLM